MYLKNLSLITLFSTAVFSSIYAQKGSFDVRLTLNNIDCKSSKASVMVQVKASDDAQVFNMGDANYRFAYNASQIRKPVLTKQENFSNQATMIDRNYGVHNLQGSRETAENGIVSLNTFYTGSESGAKTVPNSWLPVSTLSFDILDYSRVIELKWYDNRSFPVSGMNQVKVLNNDPASFEYELKEVPFAGKFQNLSFNPAGTCPSTAPEVSAKPLKTQVNQPIESLFAIYDLDDNDVYSVRLLTVSNGTATPSVLGKQLKLHYVPNKGFTGKDKAIVQLTDKFGNQSIVTIPITISSDALVIHNAISPNDDGVNDNFVIEGLERFAKNTVAVFDISGQELMKTQNYKNDWRATHKDKQLPDGTYYYVVENGEGDTYTGYLQVQR